MSQQVKQVRDSIGFAGLFLLLLVSLQTPLAIITLWFLPLPFFILTIRQKVYHSIICAIVLVALLWVIQPYWFLFCLYAVVIGTVMGVAYKNRQQSSDDVVLIGILAAFVSIWLTLGMAQWLFGLFTKFEQHWKDVWVKEKALFAQYGVQTADLVWQQVIPVFLLLFVIVVPLLNFSLTRRLLSGSHISREKFSPVHSWRLPRIFVFVYCLILIISLFRLDQGLPYFLVIFVLFQLLFLLQGFIFCAFLLHNWGKSKLWLIPIIFCSFIPVVTLIIEILGVLDVGTHWRERIKSR